MPKVIISSGHVSGTGVSDLLQIKNIRYHGAKEPLISAEDFSMIGVLTSRLKKIIIGKTMFGRFKKF
jgi:hypothetical protein